MIELPVINGIIEQKPKKPNWLRVKLPIGEEYRHVRSLVDTHKLHTICESGNCPNMGECWGEAADFAMWQPAGPWKWIGMNRNVWPKLLT